jgi:hypothetical protein
VMLGEEVKEGLDEKDRVGDGDAVTDAEGVTEGDGVGASASVGGSLASTAMASCTLPARTVTILTREGGILSRVAMFWMMDPIKKSSMEVARRMDSWTMDVDTTVTGGAAPGVPRSVS